MKILVLLVGFLFSCLLCCASEKPDSVKHKSLLVIKTDLVVASVNFFGAYYGGDLCLEKGIRGNQSLQLRFMSLLSPNNNQDFYSYSVNIYQLRFDYKNYLQKKRIYSGFYAGVSLKIEREEWLYGSGYGDQRQDLYKRLGPQVIGGYQFYAMKHLTLDFLLGLGVDFVTRFDRMASNDSYYARPTLSGRIGINIGYKF